MSQQNTNYVSLLSITTLFHSKYNFIVCSFNLLQLLSFGNLTEYIIRNSLFLLQRPGYFFINLYFFTVSLTLHCRGIRFFNQFSSKMYFCECLIANQLLIFILNCFVCFIELNEKKNFNRIPVPFYSLEIGSVRCVKTQLQK